MRFTLKLTVLGLAAYGAYALYEQYGAQLGIGGDAGGSREPSPERVAERAELTPEEAAAGSDDPVAQATAILTESDERADLPRTADGIERRRSEETVEP